MPSSINSGEKKLEVSQLERAPLPRQNHDPIELDKVLAAADEHVELTDEDSRRIRRRTDSYILPILCWVYFLQILDKTIIGFSAVMGLKEDAHLVGDEYGHVGSIGYYAQAAAQPLAAYLLVKYSVKVTMPFIVFAWGMSLIGMAIAHNYTGLMVTRFFLGWFEAACLPLFTLITIQYYRRSEQPWRVATWYSTNGLANVLGAPMCYGLSKIKSASLHSYQIIFLTFGLCTVLTGSVLYFFLDNNVAEARFLSPEDRVKGVERLRANNQGVAHAGPMKWHQILDLVKEPTVFLFLAMSFLVNMGAALVSVFGSILLKGILGLDSGTIVLLNMPFGFFQLVLILGFCYLSQRFKTKSIMMAIATVPIIIGLVLMLVVPRTKKNTAALLIGYYFLAFLYALNPLIVSWLSSNVAGNLKKSASICAYNAASALAHCATPYLLSTKYAPTYKYSIRGVLAIFCALLGVVGLQVINLYYLNKRKERQRVAVGKPAKINDTSMKAHYEAMDPDSKLGKNAFSDLTDRENEEFVYVY
ncbi:MFS general substrate transporter [Meredithblackwellia eburnea MCA 4105]